MLPNGMQEKYTITLLSCQLFEDNSLTCLTLAFTRRLHIMVENLEAEIM